VEHKEQALLRIDGRGLYCAAGDFHIDPWQPVKTALITHAHGDHAHQGNETYICSQDSRPLLRHRLGAEEEINAVAYSHEFKLGDVKVSFHPAGHILGSSQIRVEYDGQVWVVSGDYKRAHDPTCKPFEVVKCDVFITEATFALPIYRWETGAETARQVLAWWNQNRKESRPSILYCYSLGKAQRLLAELAALDKTRDVYVHGAMIKLTQIYRDAGVEMLNTIPVSDEKKDFAGELILAPPSAHRSPWTKRFKGADQAFASGWMRVRGARRRRGYDRGFVLSDHGDWSELITTVRDTGARFVYPTHGYSDTLARYLNSNGIEAAPLQVTAYGDEDGGD
jgi:putative mRNA 3-end processing factor